MTLPMGVGAGDAPDCDALKDGGLPSLCTGRSATETLDELDVTKERGGVRGGGVLVENDALRGMRSDSLGTSRLSSDCGGLKTFWSSASRSRLDNDTSDWPMDKFAGSKGSSNEVKDSSPTSSFASGAEKGSALDKATSYIISVKTGRGTIETHHYDYSWGSFHFSAVAIQTVE